MPATPIEPLVSIRRLAILRSRAMGWTEAGAATPPIVALTEAGSILAPPAVPAVRMAVTPDLVT
jgi:hypothetical protein